MSALHDGFHAGISSADYHSGRLTSKPALSQSIAWLLLTRSPAHAYIKHPRLGGDATERESGNEDMVRGSIIHHLILGGGSEIVSLDYSDWRKGAAQKDRDAALDAGKIPVLTRKVVEYKEAVDELAYALGAFGGCEREVMAVWRQPDTAVLCCGRLDAIAPTGEIYDLKVVSDAARSSSDRAIVSSGYHVQAAAYCEARDVLRPDLAGAPFEWLFAEPRPPYAVAEVVCGAELLELGRRQWKRACETWAPCLRDDRWPAYPRREARPTPWAISDDFEQQIAAVGNSNEALDL